jgi:dihydroxy-acid dehydratase
MLMMMMIMIMMILMLMIILILMLMMMMIGCDKNMPGCLIAMGRLNRPSLMVYGGTIKPGHSACTGEPLDIVSAFQCYGAYIANKITEEQRQDIVRHACPGAGACGGMYTANTSK